MTSLLLAERLYARWQIGRAVKRLDHPVEAVRDDAVAQLRAAGPNCWDLLRRIAYRQQSRLAVRAAEILYEQGDEEGLFALLEQFSDWHMYGLYGKSLRSVLEEKVGAARVLMALEEALDQIETPPLAREHWSLSIAVYALHALKALHAPVPPGVWRRALMASVPGFDDLRICRSVLPIQGFPGTNPLRTPPMDEWHVGSSLAAVRRAAVDALLTLDRERAYDLLREALAHPASQVQQAALYGLYRLRDPRAYVLIQPVAANRRHVLSRDARRVIESFGASQPDVLTLGRASQPAEALPEELLRAAGNAEEPDPDTLLRPEMRS